MSLNLMENAFCTCWSGVRWMPRFERRKKYKSKKTWIFFKNSPGLDHVFFTSSLSPERLFSRKLNQAARKSSIPTKVYPIVVAAYPYHRSSSHCEVGCSLSMQQTQKCLTCCLNQEVVMRESLLEPWEREREREGERELKMYNWIYLFNQRRERFMHH